MPCCELVQFLCRFLRKMKHMVYINLIRKMVFNTIWNTLYFWLRLIIKWVLRRTTRLCELQRICYGETKGAQRTIAVEFSLENTRSPELKKVIYHLNHQAKDKALTQDHIFDAVFAVVRIKKINIKIHKWFPEMLADPMLKIWGYRQLFSSLELLRTTSYDSNNPQHEKKILRLWALLQPNTPLESRINKQWQSIGFQGDDPRTDFRGMGLLGLENLLFFAETHPNAAQHVLLRSQHPLFGYSFAIVGINITHMAYTLLKAGEAKPHFYNASKSLMTPQCFHQFFCCLFFEFDVLWRQEKPRDMMDFNKVKTKFETRVRNRLKEPTALFKDTFVLENV